ncbi:MAG: HAMP domain-containing protein [Deltaproteobacteria bacterium]|nr:HAMP domain-containing protein [Deltaproteobacteria bacterium]
MKPQIGIRFQLIAGIVITTAAGIGLIGLMSIHAIESSAVHLKIGEADSIVRLIRAEALYPSVVQTTEPFQGVVHLLKRSGVNNFTVAEANKKTAEGVIPAWDWEDVSYSGNVTVKRRAVGWFGQEADMLLVNAPLDLPGGKKANVSFILSLAELKRDTSAAKKFIIVYAAIDSIIIIALGVYFLSRSIINPLKALQTAATRIAGGSFSERAPADADNEIGSLAGSFNVMAENLESEIKALERLNKELIETQEELLRSSTLAAIGNLAAGIAHEVGNPLAAVSGYIELLKKGGLPLDEQREMITRASSELGRIDAIVREFLDVARPPKKAASPVDVNAVIAETSAFLKAHPAFAGVNTELKLSSGVKPVAVDSGKLRQVIMNLMINAAEAMAGLSGLRLVTVESTVEMRPIEGHSGHKPLRRAKDRTEAQTPESSAYERGFVIIRVSDTGAGVSEKDASRIFDPFFTTKIVGKGTGLGLFVTQTIIKAYGGEIRFSTGKSGSVFTVEFPSAQ